jgi:hypothetical protein
MKHTRSERVSDRVYFKHKHITQPTLTPEDTIVKALNGLTHALKERRNTKGTLEIEALQKIDELLNEIPPPTIPDEATPPMTEIKSPLTRHPNHQRRCSQLQGCRTTNQLQG